MDEEEEEEEEEEEGEEEREGPSDRRKFSVRCFRSLHVFQPSLSKNSKITFTCRPFGSLSICLSV